MLENSINIYVNSGGQLNLAKDNGRVEAVQNTVYEDALKEIPRLKIIQNLWSDSPKFKLMNESE